ncbi:MAG: energy transducer TonB [Bacteroidota bacterium]|nr:energy transducer TonB [Bacteroidota bacterium]MDP4259779.1 energy transducer TonB [Bacteroidota bacterium]
MAIFGNKNRCIPLLVALVLVLTGCRRENVQPRPIVADKTVSARDSASDSGIFDCGIGPAAEYPGGQEAWVAYLQKNFRYPEEAIESNIEGTVVVRFTIGTDGSVGETDAVSGPGSGGLRHEAVRVIKESGKWTPALQNGKFVKSYKSQPVVFMLQGDRE